MGQKGRSSSVAGRCTARTGEARATLLDTWEIDRKLEGSPINGGGVQTSNARFANGRAAEDHARLPFPRATPRNTGRSTANVTDDGIPAAEHEKRREPRVRWSRR